MADPRGSLRDPDGADEQIIRSFRRGITRSTGGVEPSSFGFTLLNLTLQRVSRSFCSWPVGAGSALKAGLPRMGKPL
jgi:hypothetical protein